MTAIVDVAIIGAGPYGLSIAAHLAGRGIDFRIFGSPMHTWRTSMPEGMVLKSEGNGSNIYDPASEMTLSRYCADHGVPYKDTGWPIPLAIFIGYGVAFQRRFVPMLEDRTVVRVERSTQGFTLHMNDGGNAIARRLVVAVGIRAYEYMPPELENLSPALATHSSRHVKVDQFKGREVAIIGSGASAINLAPLLLRSGAKVTVIARRAAIDYCGPPSPTPRTLIERMKDPASGLGTGWRSWACCAMPSVFHMMPEAARVMIVKKHLPAAPGWTLQPQVDGIVPTILGTKINRADDWGGRVRLELDQSSGQKKVITADHVIAGTGYRVDVRRLSFFAADVLEQLDCVQHTPRLSRSFESSVPGLHFVGTAAANSFGPMMRFAFGAGFAARRLSRHFAQASVGGGVRVRTVGPFIPTTTSHVAVS